MIRSVEEKSRRLRSKQSELYNSDIKSVKSNSEGEDTDRDNGAPQVHENIDDGAAELAKKEFEEVQPLDDWRNDYNVFTAFWSGKLYINDYKVFLGYISVFVVLFINSLTLEITNDYNDSLYGITLGIILTDSVLIISGCFNYIVTDLPLNISHFILIGLGVIIHIVYGVCYFVVREDSDFDKNEIGRAHV